MDRYLIFVYLYFNSSFLVTYLTKNGALPFRKNRLIRICLTHRNEHKATEHLAELYGQKYRGCRAKHEFCTRALYRRYHVRGYATKVALQNMKLHWFRGGHMNQNKGSHLIGTWCIWIAQKSSCFACSEVYSKGVVPTDRFSHGTARTSFTTEFRKTDFLAPLCDTPSEHWLDELASSGKNNVNTTFVYAFRSLKGNFSFRRSNARCVEFEGRGIRGP